MKSLSQQIYNDGHSDGLTEGQANSVHALMLHKNYDSITAMDILNIQEKDRDAVLKLLEKKFLTAVN